MQKEQIFYYHFKTNYIWLILNLLALGLLVSCGIKHPVLWHWGQMQTLLALFGTTLLMWGWKYLCKIPVAVVNSEGIKIDHCRILPWKDIAGAEYRIVNCCFKKLPVIVLLPRSGFSYHYNFLQKMIIDSGFTAFSIPLYDIRREDGDSLKKIITGHTGRIKGKLPQTSAS